MQLAEEFRDPREDRVLHFGGGVITASYLGYIGQFCQMHMIRYAFYLVSGKIALEFRDHYGVKTLIEQDDRCGPFKINSLGKFWREF